MLIEDYLTQTCQRLEQIYAEMDSAAGPVLFRDVGPHRHFRHEVLTESLALLSQRHKGHFDTERSYRSATTRLRTGSWCPLSYGGRFLQ